MSFVSSTLASAAKKLIENMRRMMSDSSGPRQ